MGVNFVGDPVFMNALTPEARALVDNPVSTLVMEQKVTVGENTTIYTYPAHFFQRCALYPVKNWYIETVAGVLNRLVAAGAVKGFMCAGAVKLASGNVRVSAIESWDMGPDEYAAVYMFIHSDWTDAMLDEVAGSKSSFLLEGQVAPMPSWFGLRRASTPLF